MDTNDQKTQPDPTEGTGKSSDQANGPEKGAELSSGERPSLQPRSSLESTATILPSYSKQPDQPDQPPKYGSAGMVGDRSTSSRQPKPQGQPVSAASLSAVMATSSSSNDKMHTKRSKKVDDWNKDDTYKGKLSRMVGSTGKWNYFGADIGGNPFSRKKK